MAWPSLAQTKLCASATQSVYTPDEMVWVPKVFSQSESTPSDAVCVRSFLGIHLSEEYNLCGSVSGICIQHLSLIGAPRRTLVLVWLFRRSYGMLPR